MYIWYNVARGSNNINDNDHVTDAYITTHVCLGIHLIVNGAASVYLTKGPISCNSLATRIEAAKVKRFTNYEVKAVNLVMGIRGALMNLGSVQRGLYLYNGNIYAICMHDGAVGKSALLSVIVRSYVVCGYMV